MIPPFGKGCFRLLGQQRWVLDIIMVMVKELDFRRINDLILIA
jgi:hypothetical protein